MASRTGQLAPALEGFKEVRLIGFDDVMQLGLLFLHRPLQQSMSPAKRRAQMNARAAGRHSEAAAVNRRLCIIYPRLATFQSSQWRAGERIEGAMTVTTPVALNPGLTAPALHVSRLTMWVTLQQILVLIFALAAPNR